MSTRSLALDRVGLAQSYFVHGETEEGIRLSHEALATTEKTRSDRVRQQLRELNKQIVLLGNTPGIDDLRERMHTELRSA